MMIASMVGSGAYFYSNPYLTNAQRVVNSRMVAQGLTVALILTSAYITYQPKELDEPIVRSPSRPTFFTPILSLTSASPLDTSLLAES